MVLPTTKQIEAIYGKANQTGKGYLVMIDLPYPMELDYKRGTYVKRISCHKLIAGRLLAVFNDLLKHYGLAELKRLGIDQFAGCFNYRLMRGGSQLSTHSWGIAIDLDADRNTLKENHTTARFARPEYKPMIDIFYKNGFFSLGREKDYDWMHFQIKI